MGHDIWYGTADRSKGEISRMEQEMLEELGYTQKEINDMSSDVMNEVLQSRFGYTMQK